MKGLHPFGLWLNTYSACWKYSPPLGWRRLGTPLVSMGRWEYMDKETNVNRLFSMNAYVSKMLCLYHWLHQNVNIVHIFLLHSLKITRTNSLCKTASKVWCCTNYWFWYISSVPGRSNFQTSNGERNTYQALQWAQNMRLHRNGTDLQVEGMSTIQCHKQVKAILYNIKPSKHTSVLFITYLFLTPTCFNHNQSPSGSSVIYTITHVR